MWSTRITCLVLLLSACVALGWELQSRSSLTAPFFMWSDKQIFSSAQVANTVSSDELKETVTSLFHKNSAAPEVVILFVEPELRTDEVPYLASAFAAAPGGSFSQIKKAIETATSSVVMPYTTVDESSWFTTISSLVDTVHDTKANVFLTKSGTNLYFRLRGSEGVKTVAMEDLIAELKSANAFTNGVTDLVVVTFENSAYAAHDAVVGDLVNSISQATKGNYVAIYTANMPSLSELKWSFTELTQAEFQQNIQFVYLADDNNSSNVTNTTSRHKINYFPGPLVEVFLVCAVLITMLFTGACAIFSLQTPDKWEIPKVKRDFQ